MAQIDIKNIVKVEKQRNTVHERVYAEYTVFTKNGNRYLQIDTFGRSDRENPGKISQSFQIDEEAAHFIIDLLNKEFDL